MQELRVWFEKLLTKQDVDLVDALRPLRFLSNDPMKPLSVRLSDGEKFYKAMAGFTQQVVTASGALGGTAQDLSSIISLLQQIENNTDDLELKIGNIELDAYTINLNTDQ